MRGRIQNRGRALQVNDFSNLRFENGITPTDLDGAVEWGNELFIFFELKHEGKELDYGQRLFFERMTDTLAQAGKVTSTMIADHYTAPHEDIDAAAAIVREYRGKGEWRKPESTTTVRQGFEKFWRMVMPF